MVALSGSTILIILFVGWPLCAGSVLLYWLTRLPATIEAYILRSNRFLEVKHIAEYGDSLEFNHGRYVSDRRAVNICVDLDTGAVKPRAEVVYLENDPEPITTKGLASIKVNNRELTYMDRAIFINTIEEAGGPRTPGLILGAITGVFRSPGKLLLFLFIIVIVWGLIGGGLTL